jgi:hypothetical protein
MVATYTIKDLDDWLQAEKTQRPGCTNEQGKIENDFIGQRGKIFKTRPAKRIETGENYRLR